MGTTRRDQSGQDYEAAGIYLALPGWPFLFDLFHVLVASDSSLGIAASQKMSDVCDLTWKCEPTNRNPILQEGSLFTS